MVSVGGKGGRGNVDLKLNDPDNVRFLSASAVYKKAKSIKCDINNKMMTSKYAVYKSNSLWLIVQCKKGFVCTVRAKSVEYID